MAFSRCIIYPARLVLALLVIIGSGLTLMVQAQQVIVNSNGDKIIMYPDGSWRAVEPQDSQLLKQYFQKIRPEAIPDPVTTRNPAEEQNYMLRQAKELKVKILAQDKKVQNDFRNATNAQFKAGEMLQNAEADKKLIEPDRLMSLGQQFDESVKATKKAKLNQKAIKKLSQQIQELINNPSSVTKMKVEQMKSKYAIYLTNFDPSAAEANRKELAPEKVTREKLPSQKKERSDAAQKNSTPEKNEKPIKSTASVAMPGDNRQSYQSAPYECAIKIDTIDVESDRRQIQAAPSLLFTHTDPDLRPYFKDKELITCYGSMLKIGPYYYFTVEFQIGSSHSQNNFGALQKESLLRLKLIDGEYVSLYNIKSDHGHIDPYSGNTIFSGQYALGKDEIHKLKSSELDKIRVLWSTGFEDYDVYFLDFFINQLACLEAH